jgi:hypothetical protein
VLLIALLLSVPALARPIVAIEIDARAEPTLDTRAVRRLVQLELADVDVPPRAGATDAALFVRVLYVRAGELRIELWERGEQHGARVVQGARENGATRGAAALVPRRIALAAAELARGLRQRRRTLALAAERARRRAAVAAEIRRTRTVEGPRALRAGVLASSGEHLALIGPVLDAQLHLFRSLRLDLGAAWSAGFVDWERGVEAWSLRVGPMQRFALSRYLDLDVGLRAEASVLSFQRVAAVDGITRDRESWAARVDGIARLEPRLTRNTRLSFGAGGGMFLRRMRLVTDEGRELRPGLAFLSAEIGVVLTPD